MTLGAEPLVPRMRGPVREVPPPGAPVVLDLVRSLCRALREDGVDYVHWKSNEALDRSASGENDLDLLVRRSDVGRYLAVLTRLGFKQAAVPPPRDLPGVLHHYGLDVPSGRLVHVHWQSQLVLGDDTTKSYRIPVEEAYLRSAVQGPLFAVPAPEHELALYVVRLVVKHATWDAIAYGRGRLSAAERRELAWLEERADPDGVLTVVRDHLPDVSPALWLECRDALRPGAALVARLAAARRLRVALDPHCRYSPAVDTSLRVWRRAAWGSKRYVLRRRTRKTLVGGGAVVALVGGDGSGKSSAVEAVERTFGRTFVTQRVHLGKPRRSALTVALKGPLVAGRAVGLFPSTRTPAWESREGVTEPTVAWLLWHALNARDRRREYARARRVAAAGGIVVCDRYPLPEITLMDGARTATVGARDGLPRTARALAELERRSYAAIAHPDVLVVLRVHPAVAVARRTDEDPDFVRRRNEEVWERDWTTTTAVVVDAEQPREAVLRQVLSAVWSRL